MEDLKMLGKTQLVNNYAEKFGTSKKDAEQSINNVLAVIKDGILNDGGVNFIGDLILKFQNVRLVIIKILQQVKLYTRTLLTLSKLQ